MLTFDPQQHPHQRYNPLTGEWLLVSPHRAKRPWQGKTEKSTNIELPAYDETCYLCPQNERAGGILNPDYQDVFVFDNDFAALLPQEARSEAGQVTQSGLFRMLPEQGICRVVCFSPKHNHTMAQLSQEAIRKVVDVWQTQTAELGAEEFINYVQIFENKGAIMGCSNPHPHGQIWASGSIPVEVQKEGRQQLSYYEKHNRTLLADYLQQELKRKERLVTQNEHFVAVVPFWAVWPFEILVISRRVVQDLSQLDDKEKDALADIYKKVAIRYDNLFETSFPYSAGIHQAPTNNQAHPEWHLHLHFYPPLLRSATVKKFMVGYEMLATPQRDITPEQAAKQLRNLSEVVRNF